MTQGDIQQLLIVDDPRAAEMYCQDYIPDCHAPLPYNSILIETEEVSPPCLTAGGVEELNQHCEASQVLNVVNPDCRFPSRGAPRVAFECRKLFRVFMESMKVRCQIKISKSSGQHQLQDRCGLWRYRVLSLYLHSKTHYMFLVIRYTLPRFLYASVLHSWESVQVCFRCCWLIVWLTAQNSPGLAGYFV